jgi:hypothetical protein
MMTDASNRLQAYLLDQLAKLAAAEKIDRMLQELPGLADSIGKFNLFAVLPAVSGLMTLSEFQPNLIRLESLAHMLVARADGEADLNREKLQEWINVDLGGDILTRAEDPVEDVFVSNVVTGDGNHRVFIGTWDTPDFWLQNLIDVLSIAAVTPKLNKIRKEVDSLLKVSDAVAERSGAKRFAVSNGEPGSNINLTLEL